MNVPSTPALLPTKLPRLVILLSTVFKRTRKDGERSVLLARDAAEGAVAVAAVAPVTVAGDTPTVPLFKEEFTAAVAADDACFSVLSRVMLDVIGILLERAHPSLSPQSPPAPKPA